MSRSWNDWKKQVARRRTLVAAAVVLGVVLALPLLPSFRRYVSMESM